jgi:hypothetical protein
MLLGLHLDYKKGSMFDNCNERIKSDLKEMDEAYWKIRGVMSISVNCRSRDIKRITIRSTSSGMYLVY